MFEADILGSLQGGVIAAVQACSDPDLPVAYVDVAFTKPDDQKWLEVIHIPNNRTGDFFGQEKNYMGLLRLLLHWPNDGAGPYRPLELLASISEYFTNGMLLGAVQITQPGNYSGALREGDEVVYPLELRYVSYRA